MKRIALVIGHEPPPYPPNDPGAVSLDKKVTEWQFNSALADDIISAMLRNCSRTIDVVKVLREPDGYGRLPGRVNALKPDLVVSMHLNGYRLPSATGTEVLYWHTSSNGRNVAATFIKYLEPAMGLRLRGDNGLVPIKDRERGWYLLKKTNAPAVLVEPCFVTTPKDVAVLMRNRGKLVTAYVEALKESVYSL